MIKSFECRDFRNVTCSNLQFSRINILIGPNNSGKSNFIKALSFAANMVNSHSTESTGFLSEIKRNGWLSVVNRNSTDSQFRLKWKFELADNQPAIYTLCAHTSKKREENYITDEALDSADVRSGYDKPYNYFRCHSLRKGVGFGEFSTAGMRSIKNNRLRATVNKYESVLLQMDSLFFENKEMFSMPFVRDDIRNVLDSMRKYFRSFYSYSCASFNIAAIREMQDEQADGSYLKKDGSNFVNVFISAENQDPTFKERYCSVLKRFIENCEDVKVFTIGGKAWIELKLGDFYFPLSEISDGTVHLLILLMMLTLPESNGISMLAIDEPEMNLHPAWQKLLANELLRCKGFNQCFISTHSPDFLDEFTQEFISGDVSVFVFDPLSKYPLRQLERDELIPELEEWTLGDLYRIADPMIGGWPR